MRPKTKELGMRILPNNESTTSTGVAVAHLSDTGKVRQMNQDATGISANPQALPGFEILAMVADGMGGHQGGEVASTTTIEILSEQLESAGRGSDDLLPALSVEDIFQAAVATANESIRAKAEELNLHGMGTTLTAIALSPQTAFIANIGDSRIYLLRQNDLLKLTQDHSLVAEQVRLGYITEEEAESHPQRNVITRALGIAQSVEADITTVDIQPSDILMLCSDGLYPVVPPDEVKEILGNLPPLTACQELIGRANTYGGPDNISIAIVHIPDSWLTSAAAEDSIDLSSHPTIKQTPPKRRRPRPLAFLKRLFSKRNP